MVVDLSRPFRMIGSGHNASLTLLTRAALASAGLHSPDLGGLLLQGLAGRVMADQIMLLFRHLPNMDPDEAPAAIHATLGLMCACISANAETQSTVPPEPDDRARHRASCYIDEHLGRRDLTPEKICRDVGVSRSALYRTFAPLGGVADYIRVRRLEAAHVLLENQAHDGYISNVASGLGFVSEARFCRLFKARYRYAPRQLRNREGAELRALAAVVDGHASRATFKTWLERVRQGSTTRDA